MSDTRNFLRLNVGFIVHQNVGFSRDFDLEIPAIHIPPDLNLEDLSGTVRITRTARGLLLQANVKAKISYECVRCLSEFSLPLEVEFSDLYAFTPKGMTDSGLLLPENGIIDIGPVLREEMILAIPISPLCSPDCKGLCPICGENQNNGTCQHDEEDIDPRMDILKSLLEEG